jgi:beta-mannosidase
MATTTAVILVALVCTLVSCLVHAEVVLDLCGASWTVRNSTSSYAATVPGQVHLDLLRAGAIDDPYFRYNDVDQLWVGAAVDWSYSRSFTVPAALAASRRALLVADGLDTVATVHVNSALVGSSDNMFRRHVFDVSGKLLRDAPNSIELRFTSAAKASLAAKNAYPYAVPASDDASVQHGVQNRHFVRKEQCSFSWDWGPATVTQGIWKPIRIVGFNEATIVELSPTISTAAAADDPWHVRARVVLQGVAGQSGTVTVEIAESAAKSSSAAVTFAAEGEAIVDIELLVPKATVELWWPLEIGPATRKLYTLTARFVGAATSETSVMSKRIGFRTFDVVQEPISGENGLSFYFRVNGIPFFAKGANWIPADSFEARVGKEDLAWLLGSMVDAHMNMVRVWGGGVYASDEFYEMCDELGLMVWEEFMFACAMYPRNKAFLDTVAAEVVDQVRRLSGHPSLMLWGANNENEAAMTWFPEVTLNQRLYTVDYDELYVRTIYRALYAEDKTRPFLPSSPSNGWVVNKPEENLVVMRWGNAQDTDYGDVHYYDYKADCWDVRKFPRPRFASEYGFQSMASMPTYASVLLESDMSYSSPAVVHRQHHRGGQDEMMNQYKLHFHAPTNPNPQRLFDDTCYATQVMQAMCMKSETEHYRRIKSESTGHTMGTLYWQLNDIWQAPTWASIEYPGTWKILHNYLANIFSNFLVSAFKMDNEFGVYVVNDYNALISGTVQIDFVLWKSGQIAVTSKAPFSVAALQATRVLAQDVDKFLSGKAKQVDGLFVFTASSKDGRVLSENVLYPTSLSQVSLVKAAVSIVSVKKVSDIIANVTVQSPAVSPFVYLQSAAVVGKFTDNGFLLRPNISKVICFTGRKPFDMKTFIDGLTVRSLADTY